MCLVYLKTFAMQNKEQGILNWYKYVLEGFSICMKSHSFNFYSISQCIYSETIIHFPVFQMRIYPWAANPFAKE